MLRQYKEQIELLKQQLAQASHLATINPTNGLCAASAAPPSSCPTLEVTGKNRAPSSPETAGNIVIMTQSGGETLEGRQSRRGSTSSEISKAIGEQTSTSDGSGEEGNVVGADMALATADTKQELGTSTAGGGLGDESCAGVAVAPEVVIQEKVAERVVAEEKVRRCVSRHISSPRLSVDAVRHCPTICKRF